ncbi:MAG TPA: ATP-binding cassette domain-containing protein [Chitinophagaceae bacterium]|nr:ATP-binding cassette domain-containing protein [Chitinophagaceae bacterium]
MVTGKNIHKRYGAVEVLKGVDMEIQRGEVVSIVGPSGSGKSTLLHILGTLDYPDMGHIEVSGTKIEYQPKVILRPAAWWKRGLNLLLDLLILGAIGWALAPAFLSVTGIDILADGTWWQQYIYSAVIVLLYYTLFEYLTGRSPAKFITSTKVVVEGVGTRPSFLDCFIRSATRLIPLEFLGFFSRNPVGWHDDLSTTRVIEARIPYQQKLADSLTPKELSLFRNKRIGFVFQFHHLLPEFTAWENVCIPGWLAGRKKNDVRLEAEELLKMLGLGHRLENKPNELSGGEQQRVAVARALINKPDIVFADEPTGNLDSANAKELHQLFFDLRSKFNQTFLIVTHNEELAQLSDRILHMKDGKIV